MVLSHRVQCRMSVGRCNSGINASDSNVKPQHLAKTCSSVSTYFHNCHICKSEFNRKINLCGVVVDGLDVVASRVGNVTGIVVGVVLGTEARSAVVDAASGDRTSVESIDSSAALL